MRRLLQQTWNYIRRVSGDDAYEHYMVHHRTAHATEPPLSRQQFYLWRLEQKSRGVNRCC
jgi:uncharacterized short protein YbdD (DUF466 family)